MSRSIFTAARGSGAEVEERSGGYWRPSAGSIYPTLQLLEDEGLIVGEESDGKRRFTLTEEGKAQASERAEKSGSLPWEQVRTSARPETVHLGQSLKQLAEAASHPPRGRREPAGTDPRAPR